MWFQYLRSSIPVILKAFDETEIETSPELLSSQSSCAKRNSQRINKMGINLKIFAQNKKEKGGGVHLCAIIKGNRPAKPGIEILLPKFHQSLFIKHFLHDIEIIRRQLRFPYKISRRSATKSPVQSGQVANLRGVQVHQNQCDTALRDIPQPGLHWWIRFRQASGNIRTHLKPGTLNTKRSETQNLKLA